MIRVSECKACRCPYLSRRRNEPYNNGPFICTKDRDRETIKLLRECPLGKVRDY